MLLGYHNRVQGIHLGRVFKFTKVNTLSNRCQYNPGINDSTRGELGEFSILPIRFPQGMFIKQIFVET